MGAAIRLPDGSVCRKCNNYLNQVLDQKFKALLQPMITAFGVSSSKRGSGATTKVSVPTNIGPVSATMVPGGHVTLPALQRLQSTRVGNEVFEQWVGTPEEIAEMLSARATEIDILRTETGELRVTGEPTATFKGTGSILLRSVVRASINLVALRHPELLAHPAWTLARKYVLDADLHMPEFYAEVSEPLKGGKISKLELRPEHTLLVWTASTELWCELRFFGDAFARVKLAADWDGMPIQLREHIVARLS